MGFEPTTPGLKAALLRSRIVSCRLSRIWGCLNSTPLKLWSPLTLLSALLSTASNGRSCEYGAPYLPDPE